MTRPDYLLSITSSEEGDAITIHGDRAGLEHLRDAVDGLIKKLGGDQCDHEHLRTDAWAGHELTETMLAAERSEGHRTVHHLEIYGWNQEWKKKHGL
jgi:hypothetical protein